VEGASFLKRLIGGELSIVPLGQEADAEEHEKSEKKTFKKKRLSRFLFQEKKKTDATRKVNLRNWNRSSFMISETAYLKLELRTEIPDKTERLICVEGKVEDPKTTNFSQHR
jgi:hypothetical protein